MFPTKIARRSATLVLLAAALFASGCIKVRLTVQLNEDGSGQLIEDLVFGEKLVDASRPP